MTQNQTMQTHQDQIFIKQTPFLFLKSLVVVEFFFALLPLFLVWLLNAAALYDNTPLADIVSYNLFTVIIMTTLQLFLIVAAFVWWFVPTYQINSERIVHQRRNLLNDSELVKTQAVLKTAVHLGPLGKRFDYGTVTLLTKTETKPIKMKNVPNPQQVAQQIEGLVVQDTAVTPPPQRHSLKPIPDLIAEGESQHLEFKASFLWDYRRQNANKDLHLPVLKNVAAFMNCDGGILLVGVSDDGEILGLEPDFKMMKKKDADGWENTFNSAFNRMIGPEFRQYLGVQFTEVEGKTIGVLTARPSTEPVYLNHNSKEEFYIKTGNASQPLSVRQATNYIQSHFN